MTMRLGPGEPPAGPWRIEPVGVVVELLWRAAGEPAGRPRIVAVDGRSGGGKTTAAAVLAGGVPGAAVVHTDDIAWHHAFFDWADLLEAGVLEPLHRGLAVDYRPPGWIRKGREGSITVAAGCPLVIIEGCGAARRETRGLVDAVVWVQSDSVEARRRGLIRDGDTQAERDFWDEWTLEEEPFFLEHRPWDEAVLVVAGTPGLDHDPAAEIVVAPRPVEVRATTAPSSGD